MATPRDLDPKFKNEDPSVKEENVDYDSDSDEGMIVYRQQVMNPDGTAGEKVHGPMPVSDWPAYEKEHGL